MTRGNGLKAIAKMGTLTLTLASGVALAQQQFGPSPQAMYKQHPGSAPTYVSYGVANITPGIAAATTRQAANTTPSKPVAKPAGTKPSSATAARRRTTTQTSGGTTGR